MAEGIVHGTYAGYNQHQARGEMPCPSCKEAKTQYMRAYRASRPEARRKSRWWSETRRAAMLQLSREYPDRFFEILSEIRAQAGGQP